MKKKIIGILLCMAMVGAMAGCSSSGSKNPNDNSGETKVQDGEEEAEGGAGEETGARPFEGQKITVLLMTSKSTDGFDAVCRAAEYLHLEETLHLFLNRL